MHARLVVLILAIVSFHLQLCDRCSQRTALKQDFIHFGYQSRRGDWPWHAAVFHQINQDSPSYACGGTVISRTFIITAAHCTYAESRVRPLEASEILIRLGIWNISQLEDTSQEMVVANVYRHEHYDSKTSYNDIALLQLFSELKFTDYVSSICLWEGNAEEEEIVGKEGYVPGWGRDENDLMPDILKIAVMPIASRQACRASDPNYYTQYLFDRRTFCAGFRNKTSVGPGDSGSGLYIQINDKWMLRGIVSNGKMKPPDLKLDTEQYIVFTDVAYYNQWIRTELNSENGEDLNSSHVDECSVCGEAIEMPYSRPGNPYTRTWPWNAYIYHNETRMFDAIIVSEYLLLSTGRGNPQLFSLKQLEAVRAVFESDQFVEIGSNQIDRVVRNVSGINYIALWKMKIPLKCTKFIRPICLFRIDPYNKISKQMTTSELEIAFVNKCPENFFKQILGNYSLCSRLNRLRPPVNLMYVKLDKKWYLYGTPSISKIYGKSELEEIELSHYQDWIDTQIRNTQLDTLNVLGIESCSPVEQVVYQIYSNNVFRCFATQITPGVLITTALCVDGQLKRNLYCQIEHGPRVSVDNIFLHPHYDKDNAMNNIALVQYCASSTNASMCVPKFPGKIANMSFPAGISSIITRNYTQNITLIDTEKCAQKWKRAEINVATDGSHFCGWMPVVNSTRRNSCFDSLHGMPLLYSSPDAAGTFLRGILDVGRKDYCKDSGFPVVFIDVTFYAHWIIEQVMNITKWCEFAIVSDDLFVTTTQKSTGWWKTITNSVFGG